LFKILTYFVIMLAVYTPAELTYLLQLSEARRALGAIALTNARHAAFAAFLEHCPHPSASELADC
jgi:hypothetical protein